MFGSTYSKVLSAAILLSALWPIASAAQTPRTMTYQGYLEDEIGAFEGTLPIVFAIYDGPETEPSASQLWSESHPAVDVSRGLFSVVLGSAGSPLDLSFDEQYFLGLTVGTDDEMVPRQPLTSVGSALNSDTLDGLHANDLAPAFHSHDGGDIDTGIVSESQIDRSLARLTDLVWSNLTVVPADLADGDDVGIESEADPLWSASAGAQIAAPEIAAWNTAYGWGDHAAAGYDATEDAWTGNGDVHTTAGRVGVGIVVPGAQLHVARNSGPLTGMLHVTGNSGITGLYVDSWNRVGIRTTNMDREFNLDGTMVIDSSQSSSGILWKTPSTALINGIIVSSSDLMMGIGRNQPLKLEDLAPTSSVHIKSNGNVGIGESNPTATLDVGGDVSVAGYTQLALTPGAPPAADCDEATERGRMMVDSAAALLFICADSGWVSK